MYHLLVLISLTIFTLPKLSSAHILLKLGKRETEADPTDLTSLNRGKYRDEYVTQVRIGTPGQTITVRVDFENHSPYGTVIQSTNATEGEGTACRFGSFNYSMSSTFGLSSYYRDDDLEGAILFEDVIEFGGVPLSYRYMTLADNPPNPSSNANTLGESEPDLPVLSLLRDDLNEGALIDLMVREDHIVTPAVSMWLHNENGYPGELLFGAIDTRRYEGELVSLEMYNSKFEVYQPGQDGDNATRNITIAMTSLLASSPTGTDEIPLQGTLAVSFQLGGDVLLPSYLMGPIRDITGAFLQRDQNGHVYSIIPCYMKDSPGYFTFGFGGSDAVQVNVSMHNLVTQPPKELQKYFDSFGPNLCGFGIKETDSPNMGYISGHLLRSVYTVVDLYNHKVAMAPIKINAGATRPNIVEFNGYTAPIPSASRAPNQPSSISPIDWLKSSQPASFSSIAEDSRPFTNTSSQPQTNYSASGGLSAGGKAGASMSILIPLAIGGLLTWRRWKKRQETTHSHQVPVCNEEPGSRELSIFVTQFQKLQDHLIIRNPAELSALREPAELHGMARLSELPGDPREPEGGRKWYRSKRSLNLINLSRKYVSAQKDRRYSRQTV